MIYKELIDRLTPIQKPEDIPNDLFDEMFNASLVTGVNIIMQEDETLSQIEALENIKLIVNHNIDNIIEERAEQESKE